MTTQQQCNEFLWGAVWVLKLIKVNEILPLLLPNYPNQSRHFMQCPRYNLVYKPFLSEVLEPLPSINPKSGLGPTSLLSPPPPCLFSDSIDWPFGARELQRDRHNYKRIRESTTIDHCSPGSPDRGPSLILCRK